MFGAIEQAKQLRDELRAAFGPGKADGFDTFAVIGCCDEHEADFAWYRNHHWEEMPAAIDAERLDPFSYPSLIDEVYYRFVPGICLHLLETIQRCYENQDFRRLSLDDWVDTGLLNNRARLTISVERFLSFEHYRCVKSILLFYADCLLEIHGYEQTVEARGGRATLRAQIQSHWDDWSLYRRPDGSSPLDADEIVERSYRVFSGYAFKGRVVTCPECLPDELIPDITSVPLRQIKAPVLNYYCEASHPPNFPAADSIPQFKYLLPRMFELCVAGDWPTPHGEGWCLLGRMMQLFSCAPLHTQMEPGWRDEEEDCFCDFLRAMIDNRLKNPPGSSVADIGDYVICETTYGLPKSPIGRRFDAYIFGHRGKNALWHVANYVAIYFKPDTVRSLDEVDRANLTPVAARLQERLTDPAAQFSEEQRTTFEAAFERLEPLIAAH